MQVSIYYSDSKGMMHRKESFPVSSVKEARQMVLEWFHIEAENAEWNLKNLIIEGSCLSAQVNGYCRDEHVLIRLEDEDEVYGDEEWDPNALV